WHRPLLLAFPHALLTAGENVLDLRLKTDLPGTGLLDRVRVGPYAALAPVYARRHFLEVTAVEFIIASLVVFGLFSGSVWLLRRHEAYYGWYSLALLAWAGFLPNIVVAEIPVPLSIWIWFFFSSLVWFVILIVMCVLDFIAAR